MIICVAQCGYLWRADRSAPAGAKLSAVTQGSQPSNRSTLQHSRGYESQLQSPGGFMPVLWWMLGIFSMNQNKDIGRTFCTEFASMIKDLQESEFDLSEWKESLKEPSKVQKSKCINVASLLWCFYDFNIYKCGMAIRLTLVSTWFMIPIKNHQIGNWQRKKAIDACVNFHFISITATSFLRRHSRDTSQQLKVKGKLKLAAGELSDVGRSAGYNLI